jgi:hypothetical protein
MENLMRHPRLITALLTLTAALLAFTAGQQQGRESFVATIPAPADAVVPPLPIPPVTAIAPTGDVADVVAYYEAHRDELVAHFQDETRAAALFAMYAVHIAVPYGETPGASTLAGYVQLERAHCGVYSAVQHEMNLALGLESRMLAFEDGSHGWTEVRVNGEWELFDSTTNVWVNRSMQEMLEGVERDYRMFYTPVLDAAAPDVYRAHLQEGAYPGYYNIPAFRARIPFIGLERGVRFAAIRPA